MNGETSDRLIVDLYRDRLKIPAKRKLPPTAATLAYLVERHLATIPFENLLLHTTFNNSDAPPMISLDKVQLQQKILCRNRGGCCLELSGLFAYFLRALGFDVWLVPCWVAAGRERGHVTRQAKFRVTQSHFILLVRSNNDTDESPTSTSTQFLVDVGLGEPPLAPLRYGLPHLNQIQETPEGMKSRITWDPKGRWLDGSGRERQCLIQQWFKDGDWEPRLQWDVNEAPLTTEEVPVREYDLPFFSPIIQILTHDKSSFARKLILCRLTRTQKISLSGRKLRITTPRFGSSVQVSITELSDDQISLILSKHFGVALEEGEHVRLGPSDASKNSQLWEHL